MEIRIRDTIVTKKYGEKGLLVDTQRATYQSLNGSATYIVELIKKFDSVDLDTILGKVSEHYNIPIKLLKDDITNYIKELVSKGYLENVGSAEINEVVQVEKDIDTAKKEIDRTENGVWIKVTDRCNLRCTYCYAESGEQKCSEELSIEDIQRVLEELSYTDTNKIVITGGEPLVRKDIVEILELCKKYGHVQLLTNGTLGDEKLYKEILKHVDMIQVSLDSYNEDKHEEGRGKGSYMKALRNIDIISNLNPNKITISMTPTPAYIADIQKMIDFCLEHNVYHMHINRFVPYGRASKEYDRPFDLKDFYNWVDQGYLHLSKLYIDSMERKKEFKFHLDVASDLRKAVLTKGQKRSCGLNKNLISIDADGAVYFCPSLHIEQHKLGSIYENSLQEILENSQENYGSFCVDCLPKCQSCEIKYFCGGGCRALALNESGDIFSVDNNCSTYKERVYQIMAG